MKDTNYPLRKAYFAALSGIVYNDVEVPVYYKLLPSHLNPDNYIVFGPTSNNDLSTKSSSDNSGLMNVTIHTLNNTYNSGKPADLIADEVFQAVYPAPGFNLDLSSDNLQIISTELSGDNTQDWQLKDNLTYIDRILTFRHIIFQK